MRILFNNLNTWNLLTLPSSVKMKFSFLVGIELMKALIDFIEVFFIIICENNHVLLHLIARVESEWAEITISETLF